jgi:hypothetical protein
MSGSQNKRKGDALESSRDAPASVQQGVDEIIATANMLTQELSNEPKRNSLIENSHTLEYKEARESMLDAVKWFRRINIQIPSYIAFRDESIDKEMLRRIHDKAWLAFMFVVLQARLHHVRKNTAARENRLVQLDRKHFWEESRTIVGWISQSMKVPSVCRL